MRFNTLKTALLASVVALSGTQIAHADASIGGIDKAGGTIKGSVIFLGKKGKPAPKGKVIKMAKDPNCVKIWKAKGGKPRSETYVFGDKIEDGKFAIQNVFVSVTKGVKGKFKGQGKPVLDQVGCIYTPHVSGVVIGQDIEIKNSDNTPHNVKASLRKNKPFNIVTPAGASLKKNFKKAEIAKVQCDVHSWMVGYVHIVKHPFFAVTGKAGTYEIKGLPDGEYEVSVWHEFKRFTAKAGTVKVTIKDGKAATADFQYSAGKKK